MKALILAAGFGTRLLPFTRYLPKPLFPIEGRPLLEHAIKRLTSAGCHAIMVNTHYLASQIEAFLDRRSFAIPVYRSYEPKILGTAGAVKNVEGFWDQEPFMIVNSDVYTDIDLKSVYRFHLNHDYPVTMVLCDDPEFNTVTVSSDGFVTGFTSADPDRHRNETGQPAMHMTFTGIHVLDPVVLSHIPESGFSSIIDVYRQMIDAGHRIKARIIKNGTWKDIGTPERYRYLVVEKMAFRAFQSAFPVKQKIESASSGLENKMRGIRHCPFQYDRLCGDGSDRKWYRITHAQHSMIMVDHGIRQSGDNLEVDALIRIGHHLRGRGCAVPEIYCHDAFAGIVVLEDLGDIHLQTVVLNSADRDTVLNLYRRVIDKLVELSVNGAGDFDPSWPWQSVHYDRQVIMEKECRYFIDAFVNGYLGLNIPFNDYQDAFDYIAQQTLESSIIGFMHRDMQSRNIMVQCGNIYFIDFQGGRLGPIQYDLASLLIDPYVNLAADIQKELEEHCFRKLIQRFTVDPHDYEKGLQFCRLTRNLQILGAFGYLTRVKGKAWFEKYIPGAIRSLELHLDQMKDGHLDGIKRLVRKCSDQVNNSSCTLAAN